MKKFVFREAKLLALRKQEVRIAELAAARASHDVALASVAVDRVLADIDGLSEQILAAGQSGFTHISQTALALRHRLEAARNHLDQKREARLTALESLRQAKVATESLLALRNVKMEKHKQDCQRHTQAELDFNATRKWMMEERHSDV
jgi:hypothetical protein